LDITVPPPRVLGPKRSLPAELTDDQCRTLGRVDAEVDRDGRVAIARVQLGQPRGEATLIQEAGGPVQIQVTMFPGEQGLACAQAYSEGYKSILMPGGG
jgi:hypothetical protein